MGDFERTFGAGADAAGIVEGFGRVQLYQYRIAKVRFSEGGKTYPVNCAVDANIGDFVIVRLKGHFTSLQMAEVVETNIIRNGACKHTVMCCAENAADYGIGPDGIETLEELDRFLTKGMWYKRYPVSVMSKPWHTAYVSLLDTPRADNIFVNYVILLGENELGYTGPGYPHPDGHYLQVSDGVVTSIPYTFARLQGSDIYKRAAKFAESELYQPI